MQTYIPIQVNWSILTADRLKVQDWKIVNSSKYSLSCCTYVSTVADSYLRIPYLHIPSSGTFVFRTCVFSRPVVICLTVAGKLFHTRGPATAELLSPTVVRVRGSGTASVL